MAAPVSVAQSTAISAYIPAPDTAAWVKHLKACKPLVKPRKASCLPVLECVLLSPHPDGIAVAATDLKIGHTATLPGLLDAPLAVNHADLLAFLTGAAGDVSLESLDRSPTSTSYRVKGTAPGATALMGAWDAEEMPPIPAPPDTEPLIMTGQDFVRALDACTVAASTDSTRGVLTGIHARLGSGGYTLVASDAYRLHLVERSTQTPDARTILIPNTTAAYLARILATWKDGATLRLTENGGQLHAASLDGSHQILCTLLGDRYVNYQIILDGCDHPTWATVDCKALIATLKALKHTGDDRPFGGDYVRLTSLGDTLLIENGTAHRELPCTTHGEDEPDRAISIGLNREYLIDALAQCSPSATLAVASPTHALTATSGTFTAVIMPVTLPR